MFEIKIEAVILNLVYLENCRYDFNFLSWIMGRRDRYPFDWTGIHFDLGLIRCTKR